MILGSPGRKGMVPSTFDKNANLLKEIYIYVLCSEFIGWKGFWDDELI